MLNYRVGEWKFDECNAFESWCIGGRGHLRAEVPDRCMFYSAARHIQRRPSAAQCERRRRPNDELLEC
ncbi:unnamed protein product [Colias eurytheme]|nr:unnamed protein product [Colias eurytheme]